ncbi:hypothetical protein CKM354_000685900 [Cercospora kikuchii]|uniref:Uncharacterized protein n=1 Tax=Cercospora kikuchii TaxID=84275 RepID=A0A9P3CLN9_9PEZI|nr:uncharacterized protein CKM354_000685900 [Cercospora kikuchii]GIZ43642.1 hypothetical protein CKM354_000685900 [Cercospora kikuchii]
MQYSILTTLAAAFMAVQALAIPAPDFGSALDKRQCWADGIRNVALDLVGTTEVLAAAPAEVHHAGTASGK